MDLGRIETAGASVTEVKVQGKGRKTALNCALVAISLPEMIVSRI